MESKIKQLLRCLQIEYILFWFLILLTVVLYESEILPQGKLVDDARAGYILEVAGILLAVCLIPLSLRFFSISLARCVRSRVLPEALVSYRRWSEVRLALLLVPALINLSVYYWTLDTTGLLCAAMVAVASLFCVPGEKRMKVELDLEPEEKEEA